MAARTVYGTTWWGRRWLEALEGLASIDPNRLPRGRTYARKGAVTDLVVDAGAVTAKVKGSRARPYRVRLALPVFDDDTWAAVTAALAGELRHAAALLDGEMPEGVDEVLRGCGVSVFPRGEDLRTDCSCPDWANPCKHVAAVCYVLAETFDRDPFLLPALRGRTREALLAGLRAARAGEEAAEPVAAPAPQPVAIEELSVAGLLHARGDLAAIAVHPAAPTDPDAALRRAGPPPGATRADTDALREQVRGAAWLAWQLATGAEPGDDGA